MVIGGVRCIIATQCSWSGLFVLMFFNSTFYSCFSFVTHTNLDPYAPLITSFSLLLFCPSFHVVTFIVVYFFSYIYFLLCPSSILLPAHGLMLSDFGFSSELFCFTSFSLFFILRLTIQYFLQCSLFVLVLYFLLSVPYRMQLVYLLLKSLLCFAFLFFPLCGIRWPGLFV